MSKATIYYHFRVVESHGMTGMTVPKSRETSAVYIYAARQEMRAVYMQQDRG